MHTKNLAIKSSIPLSLFLAVSAGAANALGQTLVLEPLSSFGTNGQLATGSLPFLTNGNTERSISYNPVTQKLYAATRAGGTVAVQILDPTTGASLGTLNTTGITGGSFALNHVEVADDGAIYGINLVNPQAPTQALPAGVATPNLKIYRWANESAAPTVVFNAPVPVSVTLTNNFGTLTSGARFGDSFDVRGSGGDTFLLFGQGGVGGDNDALARVGIFKPSLGTVTYSQMNNAVGPFSGDYRLGVAFGPADSFFGTETGGDLRRATFDPATRAAVETHSYDNFVLPANVSAIGVSPDGRTLVGLAPAAGNASLVVLDISPAPANTPKLVSGVPIPGATNANATADVEVVTRNGETVVYTLNTNTGIQAWKLVDAATPGTVTAPGDMILGTNSFNHVNAIEHVRDGKIVRDAHFTPDPPQSVEFDNAARQSGHDGNLLALNRGGNTAGVLTFCDIWQLATDGSGTRTRIGNANTGNTLGITPTRIDGLAVSPSNTSITLTGVDTNRLIVLPYNAGPTPGKGLGASLGTAVEIALPQLTSANTEIPAFLNDDTVLVLGGNGELVRVTGLSSTPSVSVVASLPVSGPGNPVTDVDYVPGISRFVFASYGTNGGTPAVTTNLLFVLDPADNFRLVSTFNFSAFATAREIGLTPNGDLLVAGFTNDVTIIRGVADGTPDSAALYFASTTRTPFSGLAVALPEPGSALWLLGALPALTRRRR